MLCDMSIADMSVPFSIFSSDIPLSFEPSCHRWNGWDVGRGPLEHAQHAGGNHVMLLACYSTTLSPDPLCHKNYCWHLQPWHTSNTREACYSITTAIGLRSCWSFPWASHEYWFNDAGSGWQNHAGYGSTAIDVARSWRCGVAQRWPPPRTVVGMKYLLAQSPW